MRRIIFVCCLIVLSCFGYYLFFSPYDYRVSFKSKTLPGDIIETIRIWNKSLVDSEILQVDSFNTLTQSVKWQEDHYVFDWHFELKDSLTSIQIWITQPDRKIENRLLIPFTNQDIERDAEEISKKFFDVLKQHLEITKVEIIGESEVETSFCFCKRIRTTQTDKANTMMQQYPIINSAVESVPLKILGAPSVRVIRWSHSGNFLEYDFCFPIMSSDSLVYVETFEYHTFKKTRALKAIYNGNYITSDRAWYELIRYAHLNGYRSYGLPIEYFVDNPNYGSDELNWRAEIYLPIEGGD